VTRVHIIEPDYRDYPNQEHIYPNWEGSLPRKDDTIWLTRQDVDYIVTEVIWNPGDRPVVFIRVRPQERLMR
jgi:hypothetical protein